MLTLLTRDRSHSSRPADSGLFRQISIVAIVAAAGLLALPVHADMEVPVGTSSSTGGGIYDLACSDLLVAGTLNVDSGQIINVRNIIIQSGGVVSGGSGVISLSGNWSNAGSFSAGTGAVNFVDNAPCVTSSTISGNTTFGILRLTSTVGKIYTFAAGSVQQVANGLTITGTAALPILLVSSTPGQFASIDLLSGQLISNVSVDWIRASGLWLAPGQTNRNAAGNAPRWFGQGEIIPTLSHWALALLMLATLAFGLRARRRKPQSG